MMYPFNGVPAPLLCGGYTAGHDMHFVQARLSWENAPIGERTIDAITSDGTIRFTDDTTCWNHHPERLQAIIDRSDRRVELRRYPVLTVPGNGRHWLFSVASEVDPCRPETAESHPGESFLEELVRRGGAYRHLTSKPGFLVRSTTSSVRAEP
jgi:hypothetical protein